MISFRPSLRSDEDTVTAFLKNRGSAKYIETGGDIAMALLFNDGFIAERDDVIKGVLLFTPWYSDFTDTATVEAKITLWAVLKTEPDLRDMLMDIYHYTIRQHHYEVSYADLEKSNCFGMEVLIKEGYRVSQEWNNLKGERLGYRMYQSL